MQQKNSSVKPVTQKRLMNIALYYLGRYESSAEKLRQILRRRVAKAGMKGADVPSDAPLWIEAVVLEMCRQGYIDDERFAQRIAEKNRAAGKSRNFIRMKLSQAGVSQDIQEKIFAELAENDSGDSELETALRLVKKKKIGFCRPPEKQAEFRKKDLAVLARAGFSFQTAVKALGESGTEEGNEDVYS